MVISSHLLDGEDIVLINNEESILNKLDKSTSAVDSEE